MFLHNITGEQNSDERPGRSDFVEFRNRIKRFDVNLLEAPEPPLPRKEDYLLVLANFQ